MTGRKSKQGSRAQELKRIAKRKQRINQEADQLAAKAANMEIQVKGQIKHKGHTTKNQLPADWVETICTMAMIVGA